MKYKEFVKNICEYESDTFSATEESLSDEESNKIAEVILESVTNEDIDGIWLSSILEGIRGEKN